MNSNLFAGTTDGIFISTDMGANWTQSNNGLTNTNIKSFAVKDGNLFTAASTKIYISTDDGATWNLSSNGLPGRTINKIYTYDNYLFMAMDYYGVYVSVDNGINWDSKSDGLGDQNVKSLFVNGSFLYAGTELNGVWRRPLSELITEVNEKSILLPNEFFLFQNYPNPFNPSTAISWQSPVSSWQTIKVYDVLGNEVATLVNEYKTPGLYEVQFDADGLSSGIYFYQYKAGDFIQTHKMIFLK